MILSDHSLVRLLSKHLSPCQAETYSDYLTGVLRRDDRELALTLGYEHGLPMEETRRRIVEKLLDHPASAYSLNEGEQQQPAVVDEDEVRAAAVDWLLLDPPMPAEALAQGCTVARFFVAEHKPQKAGRVLSKVRRTRIYESHLLHL